MSPFSSDLLCKFNGRKPVRACLTSSLTTSVLEQTTYMYCMCSAPKGYDNNHLINTNYNMYLGYSSPKFMVLLGVLQEIHKLHNLQLGFLTTCDIPVTEQIHHPSVDGLASTQL